MIRRIAVALVLALPSIAWSAPSDSKPGDVRVVFAKAGITLRAEASPGAAAVATLPAATAVTVVEVKLPWIRVRANGAGSNEGWVRAYETVEPTALAGTPTPPYVAGIGSTGVSQRDVSAAGRQFSEETEQGYRTSRRDLDQAYRVLDGIEQETSRLDPYESIGFIVDGNLGRRGRDYALPGRLAPAPPESAEPMDFGKVADVLDKIDDLPGPLGGLFGGKKPRVPKNAGRIIKLAGMAARAARTLQKMETSGFNTTQEYYLGRAVAAQAIAQHGLDPDAGRRRYVRLVGDAIVRLSDRVPANHGGYHFDVLNSAEVNAVSGPGGYILITRGAVEVARDEEELAGFIAHELAHVTRAHGTIALRQSQRFKTNLQGFRSVLEAGGVDDSAVGTRMVGFFGDSVAEMSGQAMRHQYGQQQEFEADLEGSYLLYDVLYRASAIRDLLGRLGASGEAQGGSTHASPLVRAQALSSSIAQLQPLPNQAQLEAPRSARFAATLGRPPPTPPAPPPSSGPPPPPAPMPLPR